MNQTQKIIKYLAIALAIFIIINIISAIIFGIILATRIFYPEIIDNKDLNFDEIQELNLTNEEIMNIDLDLSSTSLVIKTNDIFKIETNNNLKTKINKNTLYIEEKNYRFNISDNSHELIIYLPNNMVFNDIDIDAGAGRIDIEKLSYKNTKIDFGAGKAVINNLNITSTAEIDGGAGEIIINSSNINNLDLDTGIGNFEVNAILTGNTEINSGIGKVTVNLLNSINNYKLIINKGIGSIKLNKEKINGDNFYGDGFNIIEIDNGIGEIEINSIEN